jgi:hypothetical protein
VLGSAVLEMTGSVGKCSTGDDRKCWEVQYWR